MKTKSKRPPLPKGYKWLKVGDRRPRSYCWWSKTAGCWMYLRWNLRGDKITKADMQAKGPYIAPIKRRKKK